MHLTLPIVCTVHYLQNVSRIEPGREPPMRFAPDRLIRMRLSGTRLTCMYNGKMPVVLAYLLPLSPSLHGDRLRIGRLPLGRRRYVTVTVDCRICFLRLR